jgi:hypothetical protein
MKKQFFYFVLVLTTALIFIVSCSKDAFQKQETHLPLSKAKGENGSTNAAIPPFNLEVILRGDDNSKGHVKFRQDVTDDKIINLDTWLKGLEPDHNYILQRAVDPINEVDGTCSSTAWLSLGKGLIPQIITTDDKGTANEALWRSVAALPAGAAFEIHFQVIDATTMAVVLTSDCYQYVIR